MTAKKKQELRDLDQDTQIVQQPETEQSLNEAYQQPAPYPYGYPVPQAYAWVPVYDPRGLGGMIGIPGFPGGGGGFPGGGMTPGFPGQPGGFPGQPGGFPGQPGGFPGQPGGFPGQPGFPGGGFPGPGLPGPPQGGGQQAPTSPPPAFTPQKPLTAAGGEAFAINPGGIARCLFNFTYVWLRNGQSFWYFPIFVGSTSIGGFRWNGFSWMYFGMDLRFIDAFTC
ncbi:hypothetical protein GCM10008018_15520 [Paenibacillus marchantiophytorum]|uniref:Collagen-like protein n=1 Tax=Paenibacillus marchantiophytorum TaxID=1619310 RepID=A0ABQ2BU17_9BACL|nr:hypothetical protein [Paenibacillus marchantiophytorum]GGI46119.1 hypothetical protein GCM10008018_15520 [Paenibacillus marchantiophytorum]